MTKTNNITIAVNHTPKSVRFRGDRYCTNAVFRPASIRCHGRKKYTVMGRLSSR